MTRSRFLPVAGAVLALSLPSAAHACGAYDYLCKAVYSCMTSTDMLPMHASPRCSSSETGVCLAWSPNGVYYYVQCQDTEQMSRPAATAFDLLPPLSGQADGTGVADLFAPDPEHVISWEEASRYLDQPQEPASRFPGMCDAQLAMEVTK